MDTVTVASTVRDVSTILAPLGGLALIGAVLWVIYRTGSAHVLRRRIWRLIHGKAEIPDPEIRAFVDDQTSLMSFRFDSGVSPRTLERARELTRWLKTNDESVSAVRRSGSFFDFDAVRLKDNNLPSKKLLPWLVVLTALVGALTLFPLRGFVEERALLQVVKTGTWFLIVPKADQAVRWRWQPWLQGERPALLLPDKCSADRSAGLELTQLSGEDAKVVCGLMQDATASQFLSKAVLGQRVAMASLIFLFVCLACVPLLWWIQRESAHKMSERLRKKGVQAELDLGE